MRRRIKWTNTATKSREKRRREENVRGEQHRRRRHRHFDRRTGLRKSAYVWWCGSWCCCYCDIQKHYTAMTVYFHVSRSNDSGQWPLVSRSHSYRTPISVHRSFGFTANERPSARVYDYDCDCDVFGHIYMSVCIIVTVFSEQSTIIGSLTIRCMHDDDDDDDDRTYMQHTTSFRGSLCYV